MSEISNEELLASIEQEEQSFSDDELLASIQEEENAVKKQSELQDISEVESFAANTANQVLFGFGEELAAGVESVFTSKTYEEALKENQDYLKRTAEANPKSAMAGSIVGGVAGSLAGGFGLGRAAAMAGKSLPKLGNIIIAGAEGAIAGAGNSEEQGVLNRLDEALAGGVVGSIGGAAGSALTKGAGIFKRELLTSGEELIDKSMGIFNTTMRRRFNDFLKQKGLNRKTFNDTINKITLEDGTKVFDGKSTQADVVERVGAKMKELGQGYDKLYNSISDEIGEIIDPVDAMVSMNSKFTTNKKIAEIIANPHLKNQNKAVEFMDGQLQSMFTSDKGLTLGQLHRKIKQVEAEAFAEFGVSPDKYFALPDTVKTGLKSARQYLAEVAEEKLPDEASELFTSLNKEFSIVNDFGKLAEQSAQYETKGAIAGLVKIIATHNTTLLGGIGAGIGAAQGGSPETVLKYAAVGMSMKTLAKSPTISKHMGQVMQFVGNAMAKGSSELTEDMAQRLINSATRSVEDFEVEVFNTSERMMGKLPTEEEILQTVENVKQDPSFSTRQKLANIEMAQQGINPYMQEQTENQPFMREFTKSNRDSKGKKIEEDEGIVITADGPVRPVEGF